MLLLALMLPFMGCQSKQSQNYKTIKVGVCLYKQDDAFIQIQLKNIEKHFKKIEQKKNVKISTSVSYAMGNQSIQNDAIDKLINQGVDVLCINLVDRTAAATVIYKAKNADIPIIFFNREPVKEDLNIWDKLYYVGADDRESGIMQGQIAVEYCRKNFQKVDKNKDGKIQYVMLEGEPSHQDTLIRTEYSIRTMTEQGYSVEKLTSSTANWQRSQAYTQMCLWIDQYRDSIELVMCNNDEMALGAMEAYEENGEKNLPMIIGVDGTEDAIKAVERHQMTGTVYNDSDGQTEAIDYLSYALVTKDSVGNSAELLKNKFIYLPYEKITQDNYQQFAKEK